MKSVIIISIAFVLLFVPLSAFAQTENITSKHWFITSYEYGCSANNQKSLEFYEKLTPQYLSKYDIHGSQDVGKCVRGIDVADNLEDFSSALANYDLPIIILDGLNSLDYLLTTDALGHWQWKGQQNVIVFASLSPFIESDTGAWILGHELSHFALHHKQYPSSIFGEWVHENESSARSCLGEDLSINDCPELWTTVQAPSGKNIKMMKIYDEESANITETAPETTQTTTQETTPEIIPAQYSSDLPKLQSECAQYGLGKQYLLAIDVCTRLLNQVDSTSVYYDTAVRNLSKGFQGQGDYDKAIFYMEMLLEKKPNDYLTLASFCYLHLEAGNYQEAYDYAKQAFKISDFVGVTICLDAAERELEQEQKMIKLEKMEQERIVQEKLEQEQKMIELEKMEQERIVQEKLEQEQKMTELEQKVFELEQKQIEQEQGGGCLIATATYGSELAPQVQMLREIRDNSLLQTESGRFFMESFNQFYYSFSPGIADLERENPVFKEAVKLTITPLLSSLSLLNYVDMDSEFEVLGYGISLILLNVGMYFVLPALVVHRVKKYV